MLRRRRLRAEGGRLRRKERGGLHGHARDARRHHPAFVRGSERAAAQGEPGVGRLPSRKTSWRRPSRSPPRRRWIGNSIPPSKGSGCPLPWQQTTAAACARTRSTSSTARSCGTTPTTAPPIRWPARSCAPAREGRAHRQDTFGADRLKYPMKRAHWEPFTGGQKELRGIDEWEAHPPAGTKGHRVHRRRDHPHHTELRQRGHRRLGNGVRLSHKQGAPHIGRMDSRLGNAFLGNHLL